MAPFVHSRVASVKASFDLHSQIAGLFHREVERIAIASSRQRTVIFLSDDPNTHPHSLAEPATAKVASRLFSQFAQLLAADADEGYAGFRCILDLVKLRFSRASHFGLSLGVSQSLEHGALLEVQQCALSNGNQFFI